MRNYKALVDNNPEVPGLAASPSTEGRVPVPPLGVEI